MKTKCGKSLRDLSRWVDGAFKGKEGMDLADHIKTCAFCQKEAAIFQSLNRTLQSSRENIQVAPSFETVFWEKVSDRQRIPWLARFLNGLEVLVPTSNLRQAVAFSILAFFIGNMSGVGWELGQGALATASLASTRYFSSLQEFKGVPSYSLGAVYLKTIEKEDAK